MNDDEKASLPEGQPEAEAEPVVAMTEEFERLPWHEGPDEDAAEDSWLALDDDGLLHRIETLGSEEDADEDLLEVVASHRHFFVRQEAAKRVRDRRRLFEYEDDRHVGQILVRHLNRREDLTYLERLAIRSRHVEVRSAAQVQLARVWRKLEAPRPTPPGLEPVRLALPFEGRAGRAHEGLAAPSAQPSEPAPAPVDPSRPDTVRAQALRLEGVQPITSAVVEPDGVDASLLGWAAHFIVESAWTHLGTTATRELLRRTQAELAPRHGRVSLFAVGADAHVSSDVAPGARIPRDAVTDVARWMVAFRRAAAEVAPDVRSMSLRACTALMADALREAGFYDACDAAEGVGA